MQKFKGNTSLKDIYEKLPVFEDYTMKEFFSVLEDLKDEKFQIKKEENKYKLIILIKILNKEKILNIDITEVTQSEDDLIAFLIKSDNSQKERIAHLENEKKILKKYLDSFSPQGDIKEQKEKIEEEVEDQTDNYLELDSFNINKLIGNPKLLYDYKSMNVIKIIVVLKDGRIAIGQEIGEAYEVLTHPTGISIFDPNSYQEFFL